MKKQHARKILYWLILCIHPYLAFSTNWFEVEQTTVRWANDSSHDLPTAEVYYFAEHFKEAPDYILSSTISSCNQYISFILTTLNDPRYEPWQKEEMQIALKKLDLLKETVTNDPTALKHHLKNLPLDDATRSLFDALETQDSDSCQQALEAGANLQAINDEGVTALHLVKDPKLAAQMIEKGSKVNALESQFLMTPLFFQEGEIMKLLVQSGAKVDAVSADGNTALLWYTYSNYREGIRFLIQNGADIHHRNNDGSSMLDIAEHFGTPDFVHFVKQQLKLAGRTGVDASKA